MGSKEYSHVYDFNAPDADVIVVTGGGLPTEIRAHRCVLTAASPLFRDIFSLPQPPSQASSKGDDLIPRIPVPETRQVFTALLRYLYPVPRPIVTSLEELIPLLGAALKYDFWIAVEALKEILVSPCFLKRCPLRVYGIACQFDLEDEAKIASKYTLGIDILETPLSDEMKHISAYSYQRLIHLHRARAKAATELLKPPRDLKCAQCNSYGHGAYGSPKWWHEFVNKAKAELAVRPTTDKVFEMEFLKSACVDGCPKCPMSLLEAGPVLTSLKRQIDELPSTI